VEAPESGNDVESTFLFFFFETLGKGSPVVPGDSDSESELSESPACSSVVTSTLRFFAISRESSSNLMWAFARSLASCSARSRSYLALPACCEVSRWTDRIALQPREEMTYQTSSNES
jgi:hypothetical protein